MRDLILPTTDAGVLAQLVLVLVLWSAALVWAVRRAPAARPLVVGSGLVTLGLLGLRAMH